MYVDKDENNDDEEGGIPSADSAGGGEMTCKKDTEEDRG